MWDKIVDLIGIKFYPQAELVAGPGDFILPVPAYRQLQTYTCGAVAVKMVCDFFKINRSFRAILKECNTSEDGTSQSSIIRFLRRHVSVSRIKDISFGDIIGQLDKGRPIIATIYDGDHWIVVSGYSRTKRRLYICGNDDRTISYRSLDTDEIFVCYKK